MHNPEDLLKKIKSFSHGEFNIPEFTSSEKIVEKIRMKKNIFDLPYNYKRVEIDDTYPKYIINNKHKLKNWIIE